ncbi:TolC family protein [Burkholderia sp. DN3021]|uniref:TolC family protein n=1 Tax=Burkholderia sp. DN3021 TaxID=3410137 RepID=UPI00285B1C58|nr:TolC family protein [Burkholderia ambifaria]MDR6500073.1 hypothetical protein [Burkholderia ambifaria]
MNSSICGKPPKPRKCDRTSSSVAISRNSSYLGARHCKKIEIEDRINANAYLAYRAALVRYKNGVGSIVELLKSQSDPNDARKTVINVLRDWEMAKFRFSIDIGKISYAGQFTKPLD